MQSASRALTWLATATAHPAAFVIVGVYAALWAFIQPHTLDWHGIATLATWLMTLVIQRAEHRDTQAIHGKLDEFTSEGNKLGADLADLEAKRLDQKVELENALETFELVPPAPKSVPI